MNTIKYKEWLIRQHHKNNSYDVYTPNNILWTRAYSLLSAKRIITKDSTWVKVKS